MAKNRGRKWFRELLIAVVSGVIVGPIVGWISYQSGQKNLSREVADGLALLDLDSTSASLEHLVASFDHASSLLRKQTPPPKESLLALSNSLDKLSEAMNGVTTTEYYSVEELKKLASEGSSAGIVLFGMDTPYDKFVKENIGKPKRTVKGLQQLRPRMEIVREAEAKLALQLSENTSVDILAVEKALSDMKREADKALSSLNSRREATIQTLKRFGKTR
jgi:hypothetical protein